MLKSQMTQVGKKYIILLVPCPLSSNFPSVSVYYSSSQSFINKTMGIQYFQPSSSWKEQGRQAGSPLCRGRVPGCHVWQLSALPRWREEVWRAEGLVSQGWLLLMPLRTWGSRGIRKARGAVRLGADACRGTATSSGCWDSVAAGTHKQFFFKFLHKQLFKSGEVTLS